MDYFNKYDGDMTKELNNIDKMNAIESWQESNMHPLTCGQCRKNLREDFIDSEVVLSCICGHVQKNVPQVVYTRYKKILLEENIDMPRIARTE